MQQYYIISVELGHPMLIHTHLYTWTVVAPGRGQNMLDLMECLVAPQKQYKDIDWSKFADEEEEEEEEEEDDE